MTDDDLCRFSDLPPDQCALPCHRNVDLPEGVAAEVVRGVDPSGVASPLTVPASEQHEERDTRSRPVKPKPAPSSCRWDDSHEAWVTREHVRGCDDRSCQGCKPCGKDHCAMWGTCPNHVAAGLATCPSCIGECRDNIGEIEQQTALVYAELEHSSVDSEVVNLAGPFADQDQLDARRAFTVRLYDARGWCDFPRLSLFDVDEQNHPVAVFERWERDLRREYEQPAAGDGDAAWPQPHTVERAMLSRSANYFRTMLDGRFPHDEPFEAFARDVRRLRTHLDGVLSDSRAPETGAPCPKCADEMVGTDRRPPRLVKRHGHWCDDPTCKQAHDTTGAKDRWVCPDHPRHEFTIAEYALRIGNEYLARADRLTASQIKNQYDIPSGTIRRWAATTRLVRGERVDITPKLRPVGKTPSGVQLYRVADVLALRAREEQPKETAYA